VNLPVDRSGGCIASLPLSVVEGIWLHNVGRFHKAHDSLECAWREEPNTVRLLYQGLLQLAVACHHHVNGHRRQALTMLGRARAKLERFRPEHLGIAVDDLLQQMGTFERLVREDAPANAPRIRLAGRG